MTVFVCVRVTAKSNEAPKSSPLLFFFNWTSLFQRESVKSTNIRSPLFVHTSLSLPYTRKRQGKNSWMQRNKLFSLQTVKASWGKACSGAQWLSNKVIQVRNKIKVSKRRQNIHFWCTLSLTLEWHNFHLIISEVTSESNVWFKAFDCDASGCLFHLWVEAATCCVLNRWQTHTPVYFYEISLETCYLQNSVSQ